MHKTFAFTHYLQLNNLHTVFWSLKAFFRLWNNNGLVVFIENLRFVDVKLRYFSFGINCLRSPLLIFSFGFSGEKVLLGIRRIQQNPQFAVSLISVLSMTEILKYDEDLMGSVHFIVSDEAVMYWISSRARVAKWTSRHGGFMFDVLPVTDTPTCPFPVHPHLSFAHFFAGLKPFHSPPSVRCSFTSPPDRTTNHKPQTWTCSRTWNTASYICYCSSFSFRSVHTWCVILFLSTFLLHPHWTLWKNPSDTLHPQRAHQHHIYNKHHSQNLKMYLSFSWWHIV